MADDPRAEQFEETAQRPRDDADRLPTADAPDTPAASTAPGEIAGLDLGGGGPTGATGPSTAHRSDLNLGGQTTMSGALDDLPDMTGADGVGPGRAPTPSDSEPPADPATNANVGRGSERFDASRAYTGADDETDSDQ